jgi:hypothetical protein
MKKLMLALALATLGTASLRAMETATPAAAPTAVTLPDFVTTEVTELDANDIVVNALTNSINTANADASAKTGALTWIKSHKLLISSLAIGLAGGAWLGCKYADTIVSGLQTGKTYVADKATGAWTVCKNNPRYSIPAAAVVVIALITADLLRDEKSLIKKFFSKKQKA